MNSTSPAEACRDLPRTIASLSERLFTLRTDMATAKDHADDPIAIRGRVYPYDDLPAVLSDRLEALPKHSRETTRVPLGAYRGLSFGIVLHPQFPLEVYLEAALRQSVLSRDHHGPRAVLNALERLAAGYGPECDRVQRDLGVAQSQLRDYQARLGKPFSHDTYLSELTALRDQLKAGLSGATPEPEKEERPSVSELSEQIKAIKPADTIEGTAQRDWDKQSSAEEPITARIRRRTGAVPASDPATESDAAPAAEGFHTQGSMQNSSLDPPRTFQERIILERQQKDWKLDLS